MSASSDFGIGVSAYLVESGDPVSATGWVLWLTVGLPRSGKTTWAKSQGFPIVCPDQIRFALHTHEFISAAEPFVWAIAKTMVPALFGAGHRNVIVDACNVSAKRRDEWKDSRWQRRYVVFTTSDQTCKERAVAEGRGNLVPVIERMEREWEPPTERIPDELSNR